MASPDQQLSGLTESGSLPASRLTDPIEARHLASSMISDNSARAQRDTKVRGLIDGNPPYDPSRLAQAGQRYRSNFNSGQALTFLETAHTGYYDLFSSVHTFAEVTCDTGNPEQDTQWSRILTTEFQTLQEKDTRMDADIQKSIHEMTAYGSGPMVFENSTDWTSKAILHRDFILSPNERSNMEEWTKLLIVENYTLSQLYKFIRDPEAASAVGWDVEAVKDALIRANFGDQEYSDENKWYKLQDQIRNNDLAFTQPDHTVQVGKLLFREFPEDPTDEYGGISEVWVELGTDIPKFLYRKQRKYANWQQFTGPFILNHGNGTYHSIKGLGVRMYNLLVQRERLENQKVDAAFQMSSIHVRTTDGDVSNMSSAQLQLGPYTMWRPNIEPFSFNTSGAIEAADAVSRSLDQSAQSNIAQYKPDPPRAQGNHASATEVAFRANQQAVLTKTAIIRYFEQLDAWYAERFRRAMVEQAVTSRATKLAQEFQLKLQQQGVPLEVAASCKVVASRTVGQGSSFLRQQSLSELASMVGPSLPETGRQQLIDDIIASKAGNKQVVRYNPKSTSSTNVQDQERIAAFENTSLRDGMPVQPVGTDNHLTHSEVHLSAAAEAMQTATQEGDLEEIFVFVSSVISHVAQAHLGPLLSDPLRAAEGQQVQEQLKALENHLGQLEGILQDRRQAQEAQVEAQQQVAGIESGLDPSVQIKAANTQQKIQERELKAEQQLRHKEERHLQTMRQAAEKHAAALG